MTGEILAGWLEEAGVHEQWVGWTSDLTKFFAFLVAFINTFLHNCDIYIDGYNQKFAKNPPEKTTNVVKTSDHWIVGSNPLGGMFHH